MVEELLRRGADPNKETTDSGYTPLHIATIFEKIELIEILLKEGARVNVKTVYGDTPLMDAAFIGSANLVKIFIDSGDADVHQLDDDKKTILHLALQYADDEVVNVLLEHGLSVSAEDKNGRTPLHDAVYYGKVESARTLINNGEMIVNYKLNYDYLISGLHPCVYGSLCKLSVRNH